MGDITLRGGYLKPVIIALFSDRDGLYPRPPILITGRAETMVQAVLWQTRDFSALRRNSEGALRLAILVNSTLSRDLK